jgi:trimeric autotransporter adhesin
MRPCLTNAYLVRAVVARLEGSSTAGGPSREPTEPGYPPTVDTCTTLAAHGGGSAVRAVADRLEPEIGRLEGLAAASASTAGGTGTDADLDAAAVVKQLVEAVGVDEAAAAAGLVASPSSLVPGMIARWSTLARESAAAAAAGAATATLRASSILAQAAQQGALGASGARCAAAAAAAAAPAPAPAARSPLQTKGSGGGAAACSAAGAGQSREAQLPAVGVVYEPAALPGTLCFNGAGAASVAARPPGERSPPPPSSPPPIRAQRGIVATSAWSPPLPLPKALASLVTVPPLKDAMATAGGSGASGLAGQQTGSSSDAPALADDGVTTPTTPLPTPRGQQLCSEGGGPHRARPIDDAVERSGHCHERMPPSIASASGQFLAACDVTAAPLKASADTAAALCTSSSKEAAAKRHAAATPSAEAPGKESVSATNPSLGTCAAVSMVPMVAQALESAAQLETLASGADTNLKGRSASHSRGSSNSRGNDTGKQGRRSGKKKAAVLGALAAAPWLAFVAVTCIPLMRAH